MLNMKKIILVSLFWGVSYTSFAQWTSGTSVIHTNDNVGIGVSSPAAKLHVKTPDSGTSALLLEGSISDNLNYPGISLKGGTLASSYPFMALTNGGLALQLGSGYSSTYNYLSHIILQGSDGSIDFKTGSGGSSSRMAITSSGNVGIGTTTPSEKLSVNGKVRAKEVKVETSGWPDYVFHENYSLKPLSEIEKYIQTNNHLPEIPSAKEVEREGINLGEMNAKLLQKIEELTLHLIKQNKDIEILKTSNELMKQEIDQLKSKH